MANLKSKTYDIILFQAKEARELGFNKLADAVLSTIGSTSREVNEKVSYSQEQLEKEVYKNLWKVGMEILAYHDLGYVDIQELDGIITDLSNKVISKIEASLNVDDKIGPLDSSLPGQSK